MVFQMAKDLKVFAYANCPLACAFVVKIKLQNSQQIHGLTVARLFILTELLRLEEISGDVLQLLCSEQVA